MTNYILEGGLIPEKYLLRLDNDPDKGALLKGDLGIMLDELKATIANFKNKVLTYDRLKKIVPEVSKDNSTSSNNLTDIGTIIATSGNVYTPFKINKLSSDFWSTPSIKIP